MSRTVREIRIKGRVHRVWVAAHPEGGVQLFTAQIAQSPIWASDEKAGLELVRELLQRLSRGEDIRDMVLPGGPMRGSPG